MLHRTVAAYIIVAVGRVTELIPAATQRLLQKSEPSPVPAAVVSVRAAS